MPPPLPLLKWQHLLKRTFFQKKAPSKTGQWETSLERVSSWPILILAGYKNWACGACVKSAESGDSMGKF